MQEAQRTPWRFEKGLNVGLTMKKAARQRRPRSAETRGDLGGDEGDRTLDLGIANAALSQLSYVPRGAKV